MRSHLTYANVVASLALFFALAGGSYAALRIPAGSVGSLQLRRNAVSATKLQGNAVDGRVVKDGTLTGADIVASTLGKVPTAAHADSATIADRAGQAETLGGYTGAQLKLHCPAGTVPAYGWCLELKGSDTTMTYAQARGACDERGGRVPTWFELDGIRQRGDIRWADGDLSQYEWTSDTRNVTPPEILAMGYGGNEFGPTAASSLLYYRCMLAPVNG